jgi:pilus assembly protein FimV
VPAAAAVEALPEPHLQRTEPLTNAVLVPDPPTRDVSIDELLDLEQQAEFFIVLGQDEAAIELLVEHLRSSGGTSPLPYLKLMDIYRRRGDEAAYARTRDRFNHRFNAIAPGFGADLRQGRALETYPEVIAQLQRSWPRSVDAMAELETLLFRSDGSQLFDLPAYREVLFLYSLARDLLEHGEAAAPRIDVLLPLADGADFRNTGTRPQLAAVPARGERTDVAREEQATTPVDLDLSEPVKLRAPSQFGFFEDAPSKTA